MNRYPKYPRIGSYLSHALMALMVLKEVDKDLVIGSSDMAQMVYPLRQKGWNIEFFEREAVYVYTVGLYTTGTAIEDWVNWVKKSMDQKYDNSNWLYRLFHVRPSRKFLCKMAS